MRYEFAPMEGITGYIYRNAHHALFPSVDRYYTPFITPKQGKSFTTREWNDVIREHNEGIEGDTADSDESGGWLLYGGG